MANELQLKLRPGLGVDLVFNLNSLSPISKPSIIFEWIEANHQLIVAQPIGRIAPGYTYSQMHVSALVHKELSGKIRVGYQCRILDHINGYNLANKGKADALLIEYSGSLMDINIRSAYRFHPNFGHDVMGKLVYNATDYYSGIHFKVFNISVTGLGILIPKQIKKKRNPLLDIRKNTPGKIGLLLKKSEASEDIITLETDIEVVRVNTNYNERSGFAGISFVNLIQQNEEALNRFIHSAQLHEIRMSHKF